MRLPLICAQCMTDDIASAGIITFAEFLDENIYEVECAKGHKAITILQQQKFEILFEIGAYAILDGYYREAVSSFSTSLERFHEFFIRASLIEKEIAKEITSSVWNLVAAQSERQLGAYIFLHIYSTGFAPPTLAQKEIELRNAVIHKGKIPTKDQALRYGNGVLAIVRDVLRTAKKHFPKGIEHAAIETLLTDNMRMAGKGLRTSTTSIGTIIGLNISEPKHHSRTLEEAIVGLQQQRSLFGL